VEPRLAWLHPTLQRGEALAWPPGARAARCRAVDSAGAGDPSVVEGGARLEGRAMHETDKRPSPGRQPGPSGDIWVCHLDTIPYRRAMELQLSIRTRRLVGELPDMLLLLEHPAVYTRGRRAADGELARGEDFYRARGIEIVDTDRGGRVTYHGPGQLVGYPIVRVHDIGAHLRTIESAIVAALADEGVEARSRCVEGPDYTGVWVEDRKIASIGVHVSRGIATHGFAVNVDNDLEPFSWVIACGLPDVTMTSLSRELPRGRTPDPDAFRARLAHHFCAAHDRLPRPVSPEQLGLEAAPREPRPTLDARAQHPAPVRGRIPIGDRRDLRSASARDRRSTTSCEDAAKADPSPDTANLMTHSGAPE
jgi:lipoyl(octanoyl) transferase